MKVRPLGKVLPSMRSAIGPDQRRVLQMSISVSVSA